jgi:hypothetical protein
LGRLAFSEKATVLEPRKIRSAQKIREGMREGTTGNTHVFHHNGASG